MPSYPNILILVMDTARAQSLSCYGYQRATSPNLDRLAADSVLYEQAIAPGCWSLPSQMSLLTGLFPSKHGAHELHLSYPHHYPTLPEVLRERGYTTLGISPNSWMSDEFGTTHGFDTYLKMWQYWPTLPATAEARSRSWIRFAHRLNRFYTRYAFPKRNRARHVNQALYNLLDNAQEPFFGYVIYWDTHLPYYAHGAHGTRWLPTGVDLEHALRVDRDHLAYHTGQLSMAEADFEILRACYDGALASIDEEIGYLVDRLLKRGILDRTVLIVTSDHGENIGDHRLMSHAYSLHDTLIHVPLIIRYPTSFPRGERVTSHVQLTDVFPTILDVLQVEVPEVRAELQGMSLLGEQMEAADRLAYAEMLAPHPSIQALNRRAGLPEDTPQPRHDRSLRCVRTLDSKFIWSSDGHHAWYDLRQDPSETTNLYPEQPEAAVTLEKHLVSWQSSAGLPLSTSEHHMDEDVRQRLRDLGYID
jgi:arylsulfatase A-like enzyme